jgi:hypothetical protein
VGKKNSVIQKSNSRVILNRKGVRWKKVPTDLLRIETNRQHNNHMDTISILFTAHEEVSSCETCSHGVSCLLSCDAMQWVISLLTF